MDFKAFLGGSYESQAYTADQEKTVNWYMERLESPGATARMALYPTPGVTQLDAAATGPGRAHFFMSGREFAVIGITFYEVSASGLITSRGTVALDSNPATISSNGDGGGELFITSGGNGYIYTLATNVLTQVAALNGKATMGDHLDGYFLALDGATSTFYISNLLDGTTWDTGTDFAQRSIAPDPWIAMKVSARYIWLFGTLTSEVWYNAGAASFPFAAYPSGLIPYGCAAPFSPSVAGRDMVWLSTARTGGVQVARASGFTPEVISSYPVQTAIGAYTTVDDAVADSYQEAGHTFYLLSFPTEDVTWCFDTETRLWHERGTWDIDANKFVALRTRWHAYAFGEHRTLDSTTGSIYRQSIDLGMDVTGDGIRRLRRAPALVNENERVFYSALELLMDVGVGTSGQGEDPQVMLRFSNDGGKTWGSEMWRSAGKTGEYSERVRWNRLGAGRKRVFEAVVSDPVPYRISGAFIDVGQGAPRAQRSAA